MRRAVLAERFRLVRPVAPDREDFVAALRADADFLAAGLRDFVAEERFVVRFAAEVVRFVAVFFARLDAVFAFFAAVVRLAAAVVRLAGVARFVAFLAFAAGLRAAGFALRAADFVAFLAGARRALDAVFLLVARAMFRSS